MNGFITEAPYSKNAKLHETEIFEERNVGVSLQVAL